MRRAITTALFGVRNEGALHSLRVLTSRWCTTVVAVLLTVGAVRAQTWAGSTSPTGNAYRSGNVGLGTATSPQALLDIFAPCGTSTGLQISTVAPYVTSCSGNPVPDVPFIIQTMPSFLTLKTEFIVKSSGFVDIGTATPTAKLEVQGNSGADIMNLKNSSGVLLFKVPEAGGLRIYDKDIVFRGGTDANHGLGWFGSGKTWASVALDGPVLYGHRGGALGALYSTQRIALRWNENGQVTIGNVTTPSGYKLYVEQGILTEKVKVAVKSTGD